MRDFKTMEDSLQARSDALSKKEADLKKFEAQLKAREQKLDMQEKKVAAKEARNDYQYDIPSCDDVEDSNRRMSIQMNDDDDEDFQQPPPPRPPQRTSSAPFQIFNDASLPSKTGTEGSVASKNKVHSNDPVTMKENNFQLHQQYGMPAGSKQFKYDTSKGQNNFRQPPPPPLPFKKFQHLKDEGKGRQDSDGGSATKKQRHGSIPMPPGGVDRAALQSLVTNKPMFGTKQTLRKFESL